jgi:hypothetical protein
MRRWPEKDVCELEQLKIDLRLRLLSTAKLAFHSTGTVRGTPQSSVPESIPMGIAKVCSGASIDRATFVLNRLVRKSKKLK